MINAINGIQLGDKSMKTLMLLTVLSFSSAYAGSCRYIYLEKTKDIPGIASTEHKICATMVNSSGGYTILKDFDVALFPGSGSLEDGTNLSDSQMRKVGKLLCKSFTGEKARSVKVHTKYSEEKRSLILVGQMRGYHKYNYADLTAAQRRNGTTHTDRVKLDIEAVDFVSCKH
jgi:hypothetical protein